MKSQLVSVAVEKNHDTDVYCGKTEQKAEVRETQHHVEMGFVSKQEAVCGLSMSGDVWISVPVYVVSHPNGVVKGYSKASNSGSMITSRASLALVVMLWVSGYLCELGDQSSLCLEPLYMAFSRFM